jgi:hypothetical protein
VAVSFNPSDKTIDPATWKPDAGLTSLALKRCNWINCDAINALEGPEWLRTVLVSAYYQGLADGVKHMARKQGRVSDD